MWVVCGCWLWVLLELQGVIETPRADTPHGLDVGALSYKEVRGGGWG